MAFRWILDELPVFFRRLHRIVLQPSVNETIVAGRALVLNATAGVGSFRDHVVTSVNGAAVAYGSSPVTTAALGTWTGARRTVTTVDPTAVPFWVVYADTYQRSHLGWRAGKRRYGLKKSRGMDPRPTANGNYSAVLTVKGTGLPWRHQGGVLPQTDKFIRLTFLAKWVKFARDL